MKKIVQVTLGSVPFAVRCLSTEEFSTVINSQGRRTSKGNTVKKCEEIEESTIPGDEGILTFKTFMAFFPQ